MVKRGLVLILVLLAPPAAAQPLTLPDERRPEWLERDGIVMAGSWEPLLFRVRRDGAAGYEPRPEQLAAYRREHSPEMVRQLKALGVNFVMTHCYKGAGLEAERQSMADAVAFAKLCHENGLRVGVYVYSGAFLWELLFGEVPQAKEWVLRDEQGNPLMYGGGRVKYRYYWNRNHPDAQAYYRKIVRFAVEQIRADLVHFDNYAVGPGYDDNSVSRFRAYLRATFSPGELAAGGIGDVDRARPPRADSDGLLRYAWDDFRSQSLADSYYAMSRYARRLRPDVLVECNPGGVGPWIRPPRDHGRLLQGGEAFWDEGRQPGFRDGRLESHIRTYKVARAMNNTAFCYTTTPLAMAESMAFNQHCLGAVCWFEYGRIVKRPGADEPVSPELDPFIGFFHRRRELFRGARVVADVAILRSFPSQVFADPAWRQVTARVEEALIRQAVPFQVIHDHQLGQLGQLGQYRALVLAGCVALSDEQIDQIEAYVRHGGRLCLIGPAGIYDRWLRRRDAEPLGHLSDSQGVRFDASAQPLAAVRAALGGPPSLTLDAPEGVCAELTQQPRRRLVHLVNYRAPQPATGIEVCVQVPSGRAAQGVVLASPEHPRDLTLAFHQEGNQVRFKVPRLRTYEIAVVRW